MNLIITILSLLLQAQDGSGQSSVKSPAASDPVPQTQPEQVIPSSDQPVLRALNPDQPPLLREGTLIARAVGTISFDSRFGSWTFTNEVRSDQSAQAFRRTFYLLPGRALEAFNAFADKPAPSPNGRFEVYGSITVYEGVNFLLPSLITPLGVVSTPRLGGVNQDAAGVVDQTKSPTNTLDEGSSAISNQLEVRLQDRIGYLPMSIDSSDPMSAEPNPGLIPDGTRLQNRAGTIVRDQRTGAWRFLFDSQGPGSRDPSIELLPCLHLQTIENRSMSNDLPTRIHASGLVTTYKQRNYLLLSLWRPGLTTRNLVR